MGNIVAIVGRPNVGKSTLFNRLTESRKAIVEETAGVTRDRHYGKAEWNGKQFTLIDTGGYIKGSDDIFESEIRKQVVLAIEEAQVILFLVDVTAGITGSDELVADLLRRSGKKTIVVSNKVDNNSRIPASSEFYGLGLGEIYSISSMNGFGTGELLDEITKHLEEDKGEQESALPRFAIVGRPNVGKSSLVNALLNTERNIVTDIAGTTRDTIDTEYNYFGHHFSIIDTAGIRKKTKVKEDIEFYSVMRSIRAIENCDVCILLIDATIGFDSQDMNIFHLAQSNRKGIVIVVNKWDLITEKDEKSTIKYEEDLKNKLAPFRDVPIIFASAITKQRIMKVVETAVEVHKNRTKKISTSALNDFFQQISDTYPPPSIKGKFIKIKFVRQLPTHAPSFAIYCNLPQYIQESYKRFLENKMREEFNFTGVPIQLFFRKK